MGGKNCCASRGKRTAVNRGKDDRVGQQISVRGVRVDLAAEEEAEVAAEICGPNQSGKPCRQLETNLVAVLFAGGSKSVRERGLVRVAKNQIRETRRGGRAVIAGGHDRFAMGVKSSPENLRGLNTRRFVRLELQDYPGFELGISGVGTFALRLPDLALQSQGTKFLDLTGAGHHDRKFRRDLDIPPTGQLVGGAEAHLWRSFIQGAVIGAQERGFKQVGQDGG